MLDKIKKLCYNRSIKTRGDTKMKCEVLLVIIRHKGKEEHVEYNDANIAIERAKDLRDWFGWTCVVWDSKGNVLDC